MRESGGSRLVVWAPRAALAWLLAGFVVLGVYCVVEALANPGHSLIDAYWTGRLPWIGIAEALIVSGASACAVVGAGAVWWQGDWTRRILVIPALLPIAFWWLIGIVGLPGGRPCVPSPCPPRPIDPWAVAYSAPEIALLFLILPATFIIILALTKSADRLDRLVT
ncbi:MAG: hypothetical protein ABI978_01270 [Chloroflexota bacterium]